MLGNPRVRTLLAVLAGVLAVIGLLTSVFALWARAVVFDSGSVASAVDRALAEPEVTSALASELTDRTIETADLERRIASLLPGDLSPLAPALVGGIRSSVEARLEAVLASETTRAVLVRLVETSHAGLMRVLAGDELVDGVSIADGEVRLNLLPLVGLGLREVQDLGFLGEVDIPVLAADGEPALQIASLEAAFGRDLPAEFGQLTVYRSDGLAKAGETVAAAQRALELAKRALLVIVGVTLLAYVAAVIVAVRRARAVLVLSLASVAVMVVARALVHDIVSRAPVVVADPGARAAIVATLDSLTSALFTVLTLTIVVGLAVGIVAFLRSDAANAARVRAALFSAHRSTVGIVAAAAAFAVLMFGDQGWGHAAVTIAFAAVAVWSMAAPARA
jgi:ABC-type multidrug transport system fused ATPase/permease subunit